MKVCIMSMQRVPNLGSFLQAYGLKTIIESLGHQVEFVDIPKGEKIENNQYYLENVEKISIIDKIQKIKFINNIRLFKEKHLKYYNNDFTEYLKKYLGINNNEKNDNRKYDCLVVGSDEVFNCIGYKDGFTTVPFGDYSNSKKVISYAASCGWTKIEYVTNNEKGKIKNALKKMSTISVRDKNTENFIKQLSEKSILTHFDPVLVSDFNGFFTDKERIIKEKYILVYGYYNRFSNHKYIRAIKKIAKKQNAKLISLEAPQFWCDEYITVNPKDILNIFKNAEYVITDTFHGTILSVKSNSNFVTIIRKSNKNKLSYLLEALSLKDRIVSNYNEIESKLRNKIDYTKTESIIKKEKERTIDYLKSNI